MSRQIQIRRGTAAQNDGFTGAIGEITMDTTNKTLRVHDGATAGGTKLAKESEIASKINDYFSNADQETKNKIVSFGRQFTNVGTTIAQGGASIAGTYTLGFTDNKVKIGIFHCQLVTTQNGGSSMNISSDIMNVSDVCAISNSMGTVNTITIPFINSITISFPTTSAGIKNNTFVKFVGWM